MPLNNNVTPDRPKRILTLDGGGIRGLISIYNNPSFQAFLMATAEPYHLHWTPGEERMLVVSVGTGTAPMENINLKLRDIHLPYNAKNLPQFLMGAASSQQDFLCRVFGKCLVGDPIDEEIGDMIGKFGPVSPGLFTYLRYNAELTEGGLTDLGLGTISPGKVQKLDSITHMKELELIGKRVADKVQRMHFAPFG